MEFKHFYDYFIIFIIIVKLSYYLVYLFDFLLELFEQNNLKVFTYSKMLQDRLDIIFNFSMALLLVYLFNPFVKSIDIDNVVKGLLFAYAFILFLGNFKYYINKDNIINILRNIYHSYSN